MLRIEERSSEGTTGAEHRPVEIITLRDEDDTTLHDAVQEATRTGIREAIRVGDYAVTVVAGRIQVQPRASLENNW